MVDDSDVAVFHRDRFDWPPPVPCSDSFAPAPFKTFQPGDQISAIPVLPTAVISADSVRYDCPPWVTGNQAAGRLPPLCWAGNRTCSRRSLHDVVATEKEVSHQARHPRETTVTVPNFATERNQTEGTDFPTSRLIILDPSYRHHPSLFARLATPATKENDLEAISSAHDLELKKRNIPCSMKIADILAGSPQPQDTVEDSVNRPQAPIKDDIAFTLGKRKSDDISMVNEVEEAWESRMTNHFAEAADILATATRSAQPSTVSPTTNENVMDIDTEDVHPAPTDTQLNSPSVTTPPASTPMHSTMGDKAAQTQLQQARREVGMRPAKRQRIRNIAERLGYAALGGVSVGAAIVTTLIYTAPTF